MSGMHGMTAARDQGILRANQPDFLKLLNQATQIFIQRGLRIRIRNRVFCYINYLNIRIHKSFFELIF